MKSFVTLVCPVTRKKKVTPLEGTDGNVTFEEIDDDQGYDLAEGWATMEIREVVRTVSEEEQEAYDNAVAAQNKAVDTLVNGAFTDPNALENMSKSVGREMTEAEARAYLSAQVRDAVAIEHPIPDPPELTLRWRVRRWSALSDVAHATILGKLRQIPDLLPDLPPVPAEGA